MVLTLLRKHKLYAKLSKCDFCQPQLPFLGHIITSNGIMMDPAKLDAVRQWPTPVTVTQLQSFLGLANYYRRFVKGFSLIAAPLTALCSPKLKDLPWAEEHQRAFQDLKQALVTAPVIHPPDLQQPFTVTTDASGFAVGAVLSQGEHPDLRTIAYESRKMSSAERNYPVHDKEMLAVMYALKKWRHYLKGNHVTIITDHKSLEYFATQPHLSERQARWMGQLAEFDYTIVHRPGKTNVVADALSRRPDHHVTAMQLRSASRLAAAPPQPAPPPGPPATAADPPPVTAQFIPITRLQVPLAPPSEETASGLVDEAEGEPAVTILDPQHLQAQVKESAAVDSRY
jgi:hypothetical protein